MINPRQTCHLPLPPLHHLPPVVILDMAMNPVTMNLLPRVIDQPPTLPLTPIPPSPISHPQNVQVGSVPWLHLNQRTLSSSTRTTTQIILKSKSCPSKGNGPAPSQNLLSKRMPPVIPRRPPPNLPSLPSPTTLFARHRMQQQRAILTCMFHHHHLTLLTAHIWPAL